LPVEFPYLTGDDAVLIRPASVLSSHCWLPLRRWLGPIDLAELPSAWRWESSSCQAVKPRPRPPARRPAAGSVSAEPDLGSECREQVESVAYDAEEIAAWPTAASYRAASRSPPAHRPDLDRQRYQVGRWKPSVPDREQVATQEEALPGVPARSRSPITDAPTSPIVKSAARCAEGINDPYCRAAVHKPLRCCRFQRSSTSSEVSTLRLSSTYQKEITDISLSVRCQPSRVG
jgi:hypothetical protein